MTAAALAELVALLRCPACGATFRDRSAGESGGPALLCMRCGRHVRIVHGIPRFVDGVLDESARRTRASFGYEWTHFGDWQPSGAVNFNDYFQGLDLESLKRSIVLDAGCGMGRHARQLAPYVELILATDFSEAIDQAARNVADVHNVVCVQADLHALPFANGSFDFVYSLGVLHHLKTTERALDSLVEKLRPGGRLRVYVYWKRHGWQGALLRLVTAARRVTTGLPFGLLRPLCWALSMFLFAAVILPSRVLSAAGVHRHRNWPLFVYTKYPFNVLYNDQFDRFSAPIEKRYDAHEVGELLQRTGLVDVTVRPCFGWIADGIKPAP